MDKPLIEAEQDKLHLGCGDHVLPGWLNVDLRADPERNIQFMDVTKPFPFPDKSFRLVYTEHLIEHITYPEARGMVAEIYRVLQPNGILRVVTPDLRFLIDLYLNFPDGYREGYVRWSTDRFIASADAYDPIFVFNYFVRGWGHQFIYDRETLTRLLSESGFVEVQSKVIEQSDYRELKGLENESRMPEGYLEKESLIFEARKA